VARRVFPAGHISGGVAVKRFFAIADKVIGVVTDYALLVSGLLIAVMSVLTTFGVVMRYAFDSPEPYSYEINVMFLVACILLAIPAVQKEGRNLRVDWIVGRFSKRGQHIFENVVVPIIALVFVSVTIWKSWAIFLSSIQSGETSQSAVQEPLWPMKLLVTVTMAWLALVLISQLVRGIQHLARGTTKEDTRIQL
jgi:TRAP-type mannitol/chloroaromatic compound transport system permease small subunit